MTYVEFLLLRLAEELGEIQKECLKCARFGPEHQWKDTTNFERLQQEWQDVIAIVILLKTEEGLDVEELDWDSRFSDYKANKIEQIKAEWNERHPEG